MLFNSLKFAIFLPIVFTIYWAIPSKFRWILLLFSSYVFYMAWNPKSALLILFSTLVSYSAGILLEKNSKTKKIIFYLACILCLSVLFFFKYYNFTVGSVAKIGSILGISINTRVIEIILPVGISFYTFQTLSYIIDVYRGSIPAEHHFGKYATFVSFFPQLVAGPIERTQNLLVQIKSEHSFDYYKATYGLKLMAWGFFKKIVIADTISQYVGRVYGSPQNYQGFALLLTAILFTIQLYCDFSGYSDIAVGTAKLLGIELTINFRSPFFSQSIKEFWERWHITLSSWLKDYVYIPLGGKTTSKTRRIFNYIVTFLVSGLWHGANWTYVLWGGDAWNCQSLREYK